MPPCSRHRRFVPTPTERVDASVFNPSPCHRVHTQPPPPSPLPGDPPGTLAEVDYLCRNIREISNESLATLAYLGASMLRPSLAPFRSCCVWVCVSVYMAGIHLKLLGSTLVSAFYPFHIAFDPSNGVLRSGFTAFHVSVASSSTQKSVGDLSHGRNNHGLRVFPSGLLSISNLGEDGGPGS